MRLIAALILLFFLMPSISSAQTLDIDAKTVHVLYFDNIASEDDLSDVLPFQDFERQINYLQKENYRFLTLKDLKNNAAEKSVVILLRVLPSDGMRKAVALLKRNALPFDIAVNYNQNIRHSSFPILRLDIANQPIEKMQEKLNRDTSRFRDRFGVAPRIVMVTDPGKYEAAKDIFDRYNFEHIILPNGQATIPSQIISAIPMDKRTSSLDILSNYLERRTLPVGPISAKKIKGKNPVLAYGITLGDAIKDLSSHLTCQSISQEWFKQETLRDRVEIRLPMVDGTAQNDLICTLPIFNKFNYKSDSYRYVRLYAPRQ